MDWLAQSIIKHKKFILISFIITAAVSFLLSKLVEINYDLLEYLPKESHSTVSMEIMNEEFSKSPPNARVMLTDVSIPQAMEYKKQIAQIEGVREISWLDDAVDIYQPLEVIDKKVLDSWYKEGNALFSLVIDMDTSIAAVNNIRTLIADRGEITGDIVDSVAAKEASGASRGAMLVILLSILIILSLTSSSWFEPLLFLLAIGFAIVINNGTNIIFGSISSVTQTTSSILQLAVSMDYAIFLLHRFRDYREEGHDVQTAMPMAMRSAFPTIFASGVTTIIGFAALILMRFGLGADLGMVLTKAVVLSLLSVSLLLPVLTLYTYKIIDKTHHRSFLPSFNKFGRFAVKIGIPVFALVMVVVAPAFLAQKSNDFIYGTSGVNGSSQEISATEILFGKENNMVMLIPKGDVVTEKAIVSELYSLPVVSSVISYTETVGEKIPQEFVPQEMLSKLVSNKYSRIVITVKTTQEGPQAFSTVEQIRVLGDKYYKDAYYLAGGSVNTFDMMLTIVEDNRLVTIAGIIGIAIIIFLTFRSISIPLILLLTIESAIWINLAFPYFTDEKVVFIAYIIISSIQLGATVDYAILFASRYIENRATMGKRTAAVQTVSDTTVSILTSASILMIAGIVLGITSTNGVTAQLGTLIGRGTMLSVALVLFLLPTLLLVFDKVIQKTTLNLKFKEE